MNCRNKTCCFGSSEHFHVFTAVKRKVRYNEIRMNEPLSLTITDVFLRTARQYPEHTAINYFDSASGGGRQTITYHDFSREIVATASYLKNTGFRKGQKAAIISENRPEWGSAYLSIMMVGGIAVPIDSLLGPDEIRNLLADAEAGIVFHSRKTAANVAAAFKDADPEHAESMLFIDFDSPEYRVAAETGAEDHFPESESEDIASIIYTSGTTGKPKGVMLTHQNFCSDALALIGFGIVSDNDNVLSILPLHHTYAFMCTFLVPVFLGASITYPATIKGPDIMSAMRETSVTILIGVPQLLDLIRNGILNKIKALPGPASYVLLKLHVFSGFCRRMLGINLGRLVFKSAHKALGDRFRFFASGGARLDPLIMKDLEAFGFTVLEGYGLTETSPIVTFNPLEKRKAGSAGRPMPSAEIRIKDPSESGEGEIEIKGPMVMKGYYKNPSATAEVLKDGWFRTGDIGRIDQDGYLFITGRLKEVIVLSSGKNIYPEEVEKQYLASHLIKEICIFGIEEKGITDTLHAVIVPDFEYAKTAGNGNIREKMKWEINEISSRIPSYMRIKGYSIQKDPLPRTPLGKLRRFMIQKSQISQETPEQRDALPEDKRYEGTTERKVVETIARFAKTKQPVSAKDHLDLDLGLDSLLKIELVAALEKAFSLSLSEDFLSDIQTVGYLIEKISRQATTISPEEIRKTRWNKLLSKELSEKDLQLISLESPESMMLPSLLLHSCLRLLFRLFFRLEAKGIDNIPQQQNFIITPNHTSYLDGFVLILALPFSYFRNIYSLGLSEFFTGPIRSRLARIAHVIPIDSASYLSTALQVSAHVLRNRRSIAVFPEGGRSFDGSVMEFKKGVGILAVELGIPVVPCCIEGAFEAMPRNVTWPRFRKIRVTFGPPLYAKDLEISKKPAASDQYQYFADRLREKVKALQTDNS